MKLSIGRIVHYIPRDGGAHQAAIVAAVVAPEDTDEGPGELLTLAAWKNTGEFHAVSAVPYFDPKGNAPHSWHWPEREADADEAPPERPNPKAPAGGDPAGAPGGAATGS